MIYTWIRCFVVYGEKIPNNHLVFSVGIVSVVDMRVSSEVWAATNNRLEELLMFLNSDQPETARTLLMLKGLSLILHLAALCSTPTR